MDLDRLSAIRLAGAGYGGGDPNKVLEMPVDVVVDVLSFLKFRSEYEETVHELNKPKSQ